jgi:Ca-activated chloride channel family protein
LNRVVPMSDPKIELIPGRPSVCSDSAVVLNLLIRITSPLPEVHFPRPPLNLALVLDRSGSMASGSKMEFAREAASFVVRQLLPTDRVSVTVFDQEIETIVANTPATDPESIVRQIARIQPRGSTDLQGGWAAGADQAGANRISGGINRVLLLSDGRANVGLTDANVLAQESAARATQGVTTTTLGVGSDYNEDLMEAMATAGDGNYYYIESAHQLVDLFQTELQGLMATAGQTVSLGLEPALGVGVSDVLNDFDKVSTGRLKLPNLVVGVPLRTVVMLRIPPQSTAISPLAIRFAYTDPRTHERRVIHARLDAMSPIPLERWTLCPVEPQVAEAEALCLVARAQKEASRAMARGDYGSSHAHLIAAREYVGSVPESKTTASERLAIDEIDAAMQRGDNLHMQKLAKYRAYRRTHSRPEPPTEPDKPST